MRHRRASVARGICALTGVLATAALLETAREAQAFPRSAVVETPGRLVSAAPAIPIAELVESYNSLSSKAQRLTVPLGGDVSRLLAGDVVSYREKIPGPGDDLIYRVVAYVVVPAPRIRVWVATLGTGESHDKELTEVPLSSDAAGGAVWYQYLSLPWPVADRHWVIVTSKRRELATQSDQRIWEHSWDLETGGPAIAAELLASGKVSGRDAGANRKAVYLPANSGGWIMAPMNDSLTLVAVRATAELGGGLPDSWVASFVSRKLRNVLKNLNVRARDAERVLSASIPLYTGAGLRITSASLRVSDTD